MPIDVRVRKNVYSMEEMRGESVVFVTDIEGNINYFENFIKISKALYRDSAGALVLRPQYHLVFGGDICDRGKGDLRITTEIVTLAKKYPNKVHIILGNRDINKIRLATELETQYVKQKLGVFWIDNNDIVEIDKNDETRTAATRLQSILTCTMGAPDAFKHRLDELFEMGVITEDMSANEQHQQVVDSYVNSLKEGGCMCEMLRLGSLALLLGDSLFFHGAVHEESLGWVPPSKSFPCLEGYRVNNVSDWCQGLSIFLRDEMADFLDGCQCIAKEDNIGSLPFSAVGGYDHPDRGSRLMQYGMGSLPGEIENPTLCYDSFLVEGAPSEPDSNVIKFMKQSGILRILAGHQPHGDAPLVISTDSFQVLTGDTSYARNVMWDHSYGSESSNLFHKLVSMGECSSVSPQDVNDTRGRAVSEILICFDGNSLPSSCVNIHGFNSDGFAFDFTLNEYIGKKTKEDWWVKLMFRVNNNGPHNLKNVYMLTKSHGRRVYNTLLDEDEMHDGGHFK